MTAKNLDASKQTFTENNAVTVHIQDTNGSPLGTIAIPLTCSSATLMMHLRDIIAEHLGRDMTGDDMVEYADTIGCVICRYVAERNYRAAKGS